MEFIFVPVVFGIVTIGIYGLFELFVRRKERMAIIEKLGENPDNASLIGLLNRPGINIIAGFGTLKIACLLIGIGLGLLVGFFISLKYSVAAPGGLHAAMELILGASVLIFGGLGLLTAFLIETRGPQKLQ